MIKKSESMFKDVLNVGVGKLDALAGVE